MAQSNDPKAKTINIFVSEDQQREIKTEAATLGKSYTDYFLFLRDLFRNPKRSKIKAVR